MNKKRIKDSIAISKGYHKIHERLMNWRKITYVLLFLETIFIGICFVFEICYYVHNDVDHKIFIWTMISLILAAIFVIFQCNFLYFIEQQKLSIVLIPYYFIMISLFCSIISQAFIEREETDCIFISSMVFGFVLFALQILKITAFWTRILSVDLKNKENLIKKAILKHDEDKFLQHTFINSKHPTEYQNEEAENEPELENQEKI